MNYQETIDFLYSQLPAFQKVGATAIKPKLTNIIKLCELLGNPQNNFKSIHVAGTNGKGSSSHFLASILQEAGYKVGLYTSPHLKDYRERFRINGKLVPENCIIEFVQDYWSEFQILKPSFFEVSVALAFKVFSDEKVDVAVVEVGLGGRYDSTNIISKVDLSLITNIGYDHTDILGNTLAKIAYQKAGIIKPNVPVVISEYNAETRPVFEAVAEEKHAPIEFAQDVYTLGKSEESLTHLQVEIKNGNAIVIDSGLVGEYQKSNIRGVLAAVNRLLTLGYKIPQEAVLNGFKNVVSNTGLKGRWQILGYKPMTICDTGHNEHAFRITIERLKKEKFEHKFFVLGFVKDKNLDLIQQLIPEGSELILCSFDSHRALTLEEFKHLKFKNAKNISIVTNVNEGLAEARRRASINDLIFVGGSTYLVAEIKEL